MNMTPIRIIASAFSLCIICRPASAGEEDVADLLKQGNDLFRAGQFGEAEAAYQKAVTREATSGEAVLRLGEIALLGNRLGEAERHLKKAADLLAADSRPKLLLAETYYRQDRFKEAAALFRAGDKVAIADKLESFGDKVPYQMREGPDVTRVKFVQTDPLPIVRVRVNGGEEVPFLIDTGAAELILDPEFAASVGAVRFGSMTGTFAGGKQAPVEQARVDSVQLGDFTINNVPVNLLPTGRLPFSVDGKPIRGIVGTVLMYHFVSTLDYPGGELVLRRKTDKARAELDGHAKSAGTHVVPFWVSGTHFIVAWGEVNKRERCLMHVDTGLAGGGFTCPESTIKAAGIELSGESFEGMGGGGAVRVTPFTVDELALGGAKQSRIQGMFMPRAPEAEYSQGFRIGGLVSHGFFRPYALTFDFEGMRLLLTPK